MSRVEDILMGVALSITVLLLIALVGLVAGGLLGVIPTAEPDPCEYGGTGKTASHYHKGWITYGGRQVYCDGRSR